MIGALTRALRRMGPSKGQILSELSEQYAAQAGAVQARLQAVARGELRGNIEALHALECALRDRAAVAATLAADQEA